MRAATLRFTIAAVLLLVGLMPVACASGGGRPAGQGAIGLVVQNDVVPSSAVTVYVLGESGVRRLVGTVNPSETKRLNFDDFTVGEYRFMARATGGAEIVSNPIVLGNASALRWRLSSNLIAVTETRD